MQILSSSTDVSEDCRTAANGRRCLNFKRLQRARRSSYSSLYVMTTRVMEVATVSSSRQYISVIRQINKVASSLARTLAVDCVRTARCLGTASVADMTSTGRRVPRAR